MSNRAAGNHALLIFLLGLFLINSPLTSWLSALSLPWYAIFIPWLLVIVLVALNQHRRQDGD